MHQTIIRYLRFRTRIVVRISQKTWQILHRVNHLPFQGRVTINEQPPFKNGKNEKGTNLSWAHSDSLACLDWASSPEQERLRRTPRGAAKALAPVGSTILTHLNKQIPLILFSQQLATDSHGRCKFKFVSGKPITANLQDFLGMKFLGTYLNN